MSFFCVWSEVFFFVCGFLCFFLGGGWVVGWFHFVLVVYEHTEFTTSGALKKKKAYHYLDV